MGLSIFGIIKVRVVGILDHIPGSVILILVVDGVNELIFRVDGGMEGVARPVVDGLIGAVSPSVISPGEVERGAATRGATTGLIQSGEAVQCVIREGTVKVVSAAGHQIGDVPGVRGAPTSKTIVVVLNCAAGGCDAASAQERPAGVDVDLAGLEAAFHLRRLRQTIAEGHLENRSVRIVSHAGVDCGEGRRMCRIDQTAGEERWAARGVEGLRKSDTHTVGVGRHVACKIIGIANRPRARDAGVPIIWCPLPLVQRSTDGVVALSRVGRRCNGRVRKTPDRIQQGCAPDRAFVISKAD
ncbi:MAG: hypothetical protein DMG36_02835 [Acidobacteria bacterium]|nr:MAG: hypothetical protein DMG36_02835 [Acidobacteriota bacterium]